MLNMMCKNCICLNGDCNGTKETVWTGCVYKKPIINETESHITKEEVANLIDKLSNKKPGKAGQSQILA